LTALQTLVHDEINLALVSWKDDDTPEAVACLTSLDTSEELLLLELMNLEPTPSGVPTLPGFISTQLTDWILEMSLHSNPDASIALSGLACRHAGMEVASPAKYLTEIVTPEHTTSPKKLNPFTFRCLLSTKQSTKLTVTSRS
jgi:hypothetical protein